MAEETTHGVQNKWLLIIALVLGLMTVLLYRARIGAIRAEQEGQKVALIEITKDLRAGEKLTSRHITKTEVPGLQVKSLGNVMRWDKDRSLALNKKVNQPVRKGQFLLTEHLYGSSSVKPSAAIADGMKGMTLNFDADQSFGETLSPTDTVNLLGVFTLKNREYKTYRILDYVRVINVGGVGGGDSTTGGSSGTSMKSYRKIVIEVTPEVSTQLRNLLTHMEGDVQLELNPAGAERPRNAGQINPELKALTTRAKVNTRRR